tara:strand:- start:272 stop:961 length:690 start_codon:yes stop_codon:yes gene_type:complete
MKILIPPSEGKSEKNNIFTLFSETKSLYLSNIKQILNLLSSVKKNELLKIYGTSIEKSETLHQENLEILNKECSYAIDRYTGVVYNNFDFASLSQSSKKFANEKILITSGFLGLVKPYDPIPNYKLKMNVLKLTSFWNPIFTRDLKDENFILDLLPNVHRKAYDSENSIEVDFKFIKNNKSISAGHNGKAIKGKFIRFIIKNKLEKLDEILEFNEDDFTWDGKSFVKKI